ncbi:hypothetical protein KSZ_44660 [Dictyobacter formicarum]|uniref:Uncharacterized protein n=2 Tax=Dictyobacter formicarum TaxID=2778368 RepID=A0ABQ3VKY7_9CHLR|nr:hypothetical protein KSZ_44660 [Dictyobacter formicarum]
MGMADSLVSIQALSRSEPSTPSWFGEVVVLTAHLRKHGVLGKISEQVRFARKRFGRYEVVDFLAVLFGYAISGERTLEEFYESLQPFAVPFMALFERDRLPSRSALSRFLAALTPAPVEALCTFSSMICSIGHSHLTNRLGGWWIERVTPGSSLTLMAREKRRGNVPCLRLTTCPWLFVGWMTCVLLATPDANAGKWFGPAQR